MPNKDRGIGLALRLRADPNRVEYRVAFSLDHYADGASANYATAS